MTIIEKLAALFEELGWDTNDQITINIGGTVVSGIKQPDDANPKWSLPFGERRNNRDAFIVIQNHSKRDFTRSEKQDEDFILREFRLGHGGKLYKARELEELSECSVMVDTGAATGYNVTDGGTDSVSGGERSSSRIGTLDPEEKLLDL